MQILQPAFFLHTGMAMVLLPIGGMTEFSIIYFLFTL